MGMSATQARYLSLVAQQSNLEYQGQQINQERSILSQQVSELYNSLLALEVPTPPSTSDFQTVQYTGKNGSTKYTFSATDVKPGKDGGYSVSLGYTDYGNSLKRNNGYVVTSQGYEEVAGIKFSSADGTAGVATEKVSARIVTSSDDETAPAEFYIMQSEKPTSGTYFVIDEDYKGENGEFALVEGGKGYVENEGQSDCKYYVYCNNPAKWNPATCVALTDKQDIEIDHNQEAKIKISLNDLENLYIMDKDGKLRKAEGATDYIINSDSTVTLQPLSAGESFFKVGAGTDKGQRGTNDGYKIAGRAAMSLKDYESYFNESTMSTYNGYLEAIKNSGLKDSQGNAYGPEHFMVYLDPDGTPHFALESDVKDNESCVTYDFLANGEYTARESFDNAKLTFDPSSGRITSMDIPIEDPNTGEITGWSTIQLEASTVTDELAYQDAYADYEYEQYQYDKRQQEINVKTEKIQQQDRNLELRLQRLDTQRQQITTEIEALEKVLGDNIESSYKTFSG